MVCLFVVMVLAITDIIYHWRMLFDGVTNK